MSDASLLEFLAPTTAFRTLIDQSPIMFWVADPDGTPTFFSRAWLAFRGKTLTQELDGGWVDGVHADDRGRRLAMRQEAFSARQPFLMEYRLTAADGTYHSMCDQGLPLFSDDGRHLGHMGMSVDVDRKGSDSAEDQLRLLAARLQAAREEERGEVARELHDELGQVLTALKLDISRTVQALSAEHLTPGIIDRVQSLVGLADIALATVKRIATKLRPPTLDHLGLAEAIRWEALTFKARTGLRCNVRSNKAECGLSAEQQTAVFRIFQEALTNIVRHAKASAVQVVLSEGVKQFELRISDNGRGISDLEAANPQAIGLLGMRERAARAGGRFTISGRRGRGTVVSIQVPVSRTPVGVSAKRGSKPRQASK